MLSDDVGGDKPVYPPLIIFDAELLKYMSGWGLVQISVYSNLELSVLEIPAVISNLAHGVEVGLESPVPSVDTLGTHDESKMIYTKF